MTKKNSTKKKASPKTVKRTSTKTRSSIKKSGAPKNSKTRQIKPRNKTEKNKSKKTKITSKTPKSTHSNIAHRVEQVLDRSKKMDNLSQEIQELQTLLTRQIREKASIKNRRATQGKLKRRLVKMDQLENEEDEINKKRENIAKSYSFIEDNQDDDESSGAKTPPITNNPSSSNLIQQQVNSVINKTSPTEMMKKIREQAKKNALEKETNKKKGSYKEKENQESKKLTNRKVISNIEKVQKKTVSKHDQKQEEKYSISSTSKSSSEYDSSSQSNDDSYDKSKNSDTSMPDNESKSTEMDNSERKSRKIDETRRSKKIKNSKRLTKQTKINITRNNSCYYSIKLKIEKGKIPTKQLSKQLKLWLKTLQTMDPTVVIYEYSSETPTQAITSPKDISDDITFLKRYFTNISIKPNGGHTWFQVWLGHDDSSENLIINTKHWMKENDSNIYKKRLQEKYTVKEYWLMWSTERMDPQSLHHAVMEVIDKHTAGIQHNFAFSFGMIRKDPRYTSTSEYNSRPSQKYNKAMIIEAKKENKDTVYNTLGRIFSTTSNIKILGTDLRMVPMLSNDLPSHTKMKVNHLIGKQEQYLASLKTKACTYLQEIDYYNVNLETTLRNMIMELETLRTFDKDGNPMKIFTNVDFSEWHACYILTYPSHLEKEADDYITQLPSFLHHIYGDEVLLMMTAEGAIKAQQCPWDPVKLCATSKLDLELDAVTSESQKNKAWLIDKPKNLKFDIPALEIQNNIYNRATDADSISTFTSKRLINRDQEILKDQFHNDEIEVSKQQEEQDETSSTEIGNSEETEEDENDPSIITPNKLTTSPSGGQTRESVYHDDDNPPRRMESDLGVPL